jgi:hypothetical protein
MTESSPITAAQTKPLPKIRRPIWVTFIVLGVLSLAVFNLARAIQSVLSWTYLLEALSVSPLYLLLSGGLWALVGFPLAWGLWRGRPNAPAMARRTALAYTAYVWLDRLLLSFSSYRNNSAPFWAALNLLILAFGFGVLALRPVRRFYGETHEPTPPSGPAGALEPVPGDPPGGPASAGEDPPAA